jgi:hypothetical protein
LFGERRVEKQMRKIQPRGERAVALADPLAVRPAVRTRRRLRRQLLESLLENFHA